MDNQKLKKTIITAGAILILGIVGVTLFIAFDLGAGEETLNEDNVMTTADVKIGNIEKSISGSGSLEADETESITMPVACQIEEVLVQSGQRVQVGDTLAKLDVSSLEAKLQELQSDFDDKNSQLSSVSVSSKTIKIRAPFDGEVEDEYLSKYADVDETIAEYGCLLTLVGENETIKIGESVPSGTIKSVYAYNGKDVDKGDSLFKITVEETEFTNLTNEVNELTDQIALVEGYIANPYIVATTDGIVTGELGQEGTDLEQDSEVMQIAVEGCYVVTISVNAEDLMANVYQGQDALIKLDGDIQLEAQVEHINYVGNDKGEYEVEVVTKGEMETALIGQNADVAVLVENVENVMTIPIEAVYKDSQGDYVMIYRGEGDLTQYEDIEIPKEKSYVELGMISEKYVEVVSGVQKNDVVLITLSSNEKAGHGYKGNAAAMLGGR